MGMFDRIWFKCPNCNHMMEAQSKAGDCLLNDYNQDEIPENIARSIEGESIWCEKCERSYTIGDRKTSTVSLEVR